MAGAISLESGVMTDRPDRARPIDQTSAAAQAMLQLHCASLLMGVRARAPLR